MKIEAVAFYPCEIKAKKSVMLGTLHIRIISVDCGDIIISCMPIHVRGIRVFQKGKQLFFSMPRGIQLDQETGKTIPFPTFCFEDVDKNREFIQNVQHIGKVFIESNFPQCLRKFPTK